MPRKPTGNNGFTRVIVSGNEARSEFHKDNLGNDKPEIERNILSRFVSAMISVTGASLTWKQNFEDDLDFTLFAPGGEIHIELTELVLTDQKGPPFSSKNKLRTYGEVADALVACVRHKDRRYQRSEIPKHLLVYTTHFPFTPPSAAICLAQAALREQPPLILENVFFLEQPPTDPIVRCLYPVPDIILQNFHPAEWRELQFFNFDPADAVLSKAEPPLEVIRALSRKGGSGGGT